MAAQKPLVIINGQIQQIPTGDTISVAASSAEIVSSLNANAAAIVIGTPVYVSAAGSVNKASASAVGTSRVLGLVQTSSIAPAASGSIITGGVITAATGEWDVVAGTTGGLTAGTLYYLSTTAGMITSTAPVGAGQYVMSIGLGLSPTEMEIDTNRSGVLLS